MYVCTYVCMHCTYLHMYVFTYICMYLRTYVYTYVGGYICTYVGMYVCTNVCTYVCMYGLCIYVCVCVRMYVCMYVLIYYSLYLTLKSINQSQRVSSNFWGRCNSNCEKIITFIIAAHKSMQFRSMDSSDNAQIVLQAWRLRLDLWSGQRFFLLSVSILSVSTLSIPPLWVSVPLFSRYYCVCRRRSSGLLVSLDAGWK